MEIALDPERQKLAREYARRRRHVWLIQTLWSAVFLYAWLALGWSLALRERLASCFMNEWILNAVFFLILGGVFAVLSTPFHYYDSYVLPQRYGQSNQSVKQWSLDQIKGLAIGIPFGLVMLELLYQALKLSGDMWWLWAAGGLLIFSVLLTNLAPILILPWFNKFVPLGEEHRELADRLIRLAEQAGTKVNGVFKFDMSRRTKSANAALTGIGNTRRIVLGDTLLDEFSTDEIETVLAHELGHHVHRDIPLLIAAGTCSTALGLYLASRVLDWSVNFFQFESVSDVAGFPALALVLGGYSLLTMPIENALSRWRERMADDYALISTGKGGAFASAFIRLANQNLGEIDPEKWVVWMFHSHPPLGERIAKARGFSDSGSH